jgi:hypothetical protein
MVGDETWIHLFLSESNQENNSKYVVSGFNSFLFT